MMKKMKKLFTSIIIVYFSAFVALAMEETGDKNKLSYQDGNMPIEKKEEDTLPYYRFIGSFAYFKQECEKLPLYSDKNVLHSDKNVLHSDKNVLPKKTPLKKYQFEKLIGKFINKQQYDLERYDIDVEKNREEERKRIAEERKRIAEERKRMWWWQKVISWAYRKKEVKREVEKGDKKEIRLPFKPVAQKLILPAESVIAFHGDLHGDIHSTLEFIQHLADQGYMKKNNAYKIAKKNFYMIFLGDYVDRGWYGAEVLNTILTLKLMNWDQVFLVRGNHEDVTVQGMYGFADELKNKFQINLGTTEEGKYNSLANKLYNMQELMPVVLYLGNKNEKNITEVIQCCHGGIEIGYHPGDLLKNEKSCMYQLLNISKKTRIKNIKLDSSKVKSNGGKTEADKSHDKSKEQTYENLHEHINNLDDQGAVIDCLINYEFTTPVSIFGVGSLGFMWNDFNVSPIDKIKIARGGALSYGKFETNRVLKHIYRPEGAQYKVCGIFRAHQHGTLSGDSVSPMMKRIWNKDGIGAEEDTGVGKIWIDEKANNGPGGLWDGIVCTFAVTPKGFYGLDAEVKKMGDAFGLLTLKNGFKNWNLDVIRLKDGKVVVSDKNDDEEDGEEEKGKDQH